MRTYLAMNRFGLGAGPGDASVGDPVRWLETQIDSFDAAPPALAALPGRAELAEAVVAYLDIARGVRQIRRDAETDGLPRMGNPENPEVAAALAERRDGRRSIRELYIDAVNARTLAALTSATPFIERWTHFWANHFAVSIDKLVVAPFAGDHEFRAVRPHVLGSFAGLLRAAVTHPAMLLFLDQAQSIGPDSMVAQRIGARGTGRQIGLNENLAREILELHTLGVRSGYSQTDVTELARALTGITIAGLARGPAARLMPPGAEPGEPVFVAAIHQPGSRTILGQSYRQDGVRQSEAILDALAVHPFTARHIATKLARHFAADDPPPALITRLERNFLETGGNLAALARTLIASPEAWQTSAPKFKSPWDWMVSGFRAFGIRELPNRMGIVGLLDQLGQPAWRPGSPAGYGDDNATWAGPQALTDRVDVAERLAGRMGTLDPRAIAATALADAIDPATSSAIARADSPAQGLALTLLTPAFLRR